MSLSALSLRTSALRSQPIEVRQRVAVWLVFLLLCAPLWVCDLHLASSDVNLSAPLVIGAQDTLPLTGGGMSTPVAPLSCAFHCTQHPALFSVLLFNAVLVSLATPCLLATARFHARLGLPPLLPPPQTR